MHRGEHRDEQTNKKRGSNHEYKGTRNRCGRKFFLRRTTAIFSRQPGANPRPFPTEIL
jgi:hypothetical protein